MAIENAKYLNTRIILKNDTLTNWEGSSLILQPGEVAFAKIESSDKYAAPTYLMKVGDGSNTFSDLKWVAANAADVYKWAKSKEIKTAGTGNAVTGVSVINNDDGTTSVVLNKDVTFALASDLNNYTTTEDLIELLDEYITEDELATALKSITDRLDAIQADYLKSADKTALQNAISSENARAQGVEANLDGRLEKVEAFFEGAAEDGEGLANALDTLVEIQNYITEDGEAASKMVEDISDNADAIAAIEADYLKAADKTALQAEIDADVKALADGAVKTNTGKIAAIEADYLKSADKTALQAEIDADVKALKDGDVKANADAIADLQDEVKTLTKDADLAAIAKTGSTDDLVQGNLVLVFDCGTSAV